MAILAIAVRAERVAKEVERLAPGIPNRGLPLVEGESKLGHHLPRPRQRLPRGLAAEDDEVSRAAESHHRALAEPDVRLSPHPAPIVQPRP